MGQNRIPFEFTRSNPWSPADGQAGKLHINFIKPSMVTAQGLPHNVQYPSLTTLTSATTPDTITQSMLLHSNSFIHQSLGTKTSFVKDTQGTSAKLASNAGWFLPSSFNIAQAYYDDRLISFQDNLTGMTYSNTDYDGTSRKSKYDDSETSASTSGSHLNLPDSYGESTTIMTTPYRILGLPHGGTLLASYSKNNPENTTANIFNCTFGQSVLSYPPSMWPAKQPCCHEKLQKSLDESFRLTNADSIMNYYANCKNIPVGIPVV